MNKPLRNIVYWGGALSAYALMVMAVLCLLLDLNVGQLLQPQEKKPYTAVAQEEALSSLNSEVASSDLFGILLPIGPNDGQLPGLPELWNEFLRAGGADVERMDANGFDGLQAVKSIADFSRGSVAELFLSGAPLQVFRRGKFLLVLNNSGRLQVVDCENPRTPKMSSSLLYHGVKRMEMKGDIAYLHIGSQGSLQNKLVVVDLEDLRKPRVLAQFNLPEQTVSFFLSHHQLVVYTSSRGYKGEYFVHLYDFADGYQPILVGSRKSFLLNSGFLKYDEYLLVPGLRSGLNVFSSSNQLEPVLVSSIAFPDVVKQLVRHGDIVFANGEGSMYVIDLHDPLNPVLSTAIDEAHYSASFVGLGDYLYYFTENGYLRVFDIPPFASLVGGDKESAGIAGELVSTQAGDGFTLLGEVQGALPVAVNDVLALPGKPNVIDKLFWQGELVVLADDGLIQLFQKGDTEALELNDSLKLPSSQRWLAASNDRLYVGGESTVSVIAKSDDGYVTLSGQFEYHGEASWDGLVVERNLCIAAGKDGVLCSSIEQPDRLMASPGWSIPQQLRSLVDVRLLASPGDNRLLAAAGPAGVLSGRVNDHGQLQFDGFIDFSAPIYALAVVEGFCLVSTGDSVRVIDIRSRDSLQSLGVIAFPEVEKFAVAAPDFWAGYVPGEGWLTFPVPRFVSPADVELLQTSHNSIPAESLHGRYRLNLFNDREIKTVPGIFTYTLLDGVRTAGVAHGIQ